MLMTFDGLRRVMSVSQRFAGHAVVPFSDLLFVIFCPQVMAIVESLEANDKKARAMANEAQHWAYRYQGGFLTSLKCDQPEV
jgi:hypothetical protein